MLAVVTTIEPLAAITVMVEDLLSQVRQAATSQVHQEETTGVASLQTTTLRRRPGASGWTFPRGIASSSRIPTNKTGTGSCMGGEQQAFTGAIKPHHPRHTTQTAARVGPPSWARANDAGPEARASSGPGAGPQTAMVEVLALARSGASGSFPATDTPHSLPQIAGSFWTSSPFPMGRGQKPRERVFSVEPTASWMDRKNCHFFRFRGLPWIG